MSRPRKSDNEKKQRILVTIDKSIYNNLKQKRINISSSVNRLLKVAYTNVISPESVTVGQEPRRAHNPKVGSSNLPPATPFLSILSLIDWINRQNVSDRYAKDILAKLPQILGKSIYENSDELYKEFRNKELDKYSTLTVRMILRHLENQGTKEDELVKIRKLLKSKRSNCDNFVPTDEEVGKTLEKLNEYNKILYTLFLASGIRKVEGKYILDNLKSLQVQDMNGFVKINMSLYRNTKNSFFCYIPTSLWEKIEANKEHLSVDSLDMSLKRQKLIPIKYCRKWFYTKCIELGIPEAIADFYQGRTSQGIGSNHYLAKQRMADENYKHILSNLVGKHF